MGVIQHIKQKIKGRIPWNALSSIFLFCVLTTFLSLTTTAQSNCVASIDNTNTQICLGSSSITFSNAIASGGIIDWISSGDGTFNDPSLQNATYTPGPNDIARGYVFIYLDVYTDDPVNPCSALPVVTLFLSSMNASAAPSAQTICSGGTISQITLSGSPTGTIYNWTRNNTVSAPGLAASGSGNIRGALANNTAAPVTVTFSITPTAASCSGTPITATVLVNPRPTAVATPTSQTICSGSTITPIALTGAVSGTTYTWTRNNTASVTGIGASGTGSITGALTNTTASPVTVTFTITPTANGCTGTAISATVLVNPATNVVIANPSLQTICSGSTISPIVLSGGAGGATYNWTRNNTASVTGIAANGSGNISGTLTNTTTAPLYVTFTITASTGGCSNTAAILVNPIPNAVATPSSQTICSGASIAPVIFSGNVSGTTYNWTRDNTATVTGIAATGNGNISGALINNTAAPLTVTFTITPTPNGCSGVPITATATVNPRPTSVISGDQTICAGHLSSNISIGLTGTGPWTFTYSDGTLPVTVSNASTNPYTFTVTPPALPAIYTVTSLNDSRCSAVAGGMTGSATLAQISYSITATAGANGSVTPNGTTSVNCGSNQTFSITANSCYQIADVIVDGVSQGAISTYTFTNVQAAHSISATFSPASFSINASAGDHGSISPNGITLLGCGTSQAYTMTPNNGCNIQDVLVDGVSQGVISTYIFSNITSPHTISAIFVSGEFMVTASAGAGGTITPAGAVSVMGGTSQTFNIASDPCNQITDVMVDGISQGTISTYTFSDVTESHIINASFSGLSYIITATAGANGSITPAGATSVACGTNQIFNITANPCYQIADVIVDGISQGAISTYTFSNVTGEHAISVTFSQLTYSITASAGENGSISPDGITLVGCGLGQVYTLTPQGGFNIQDVLVDGVSQGAIGTYTFSNVTGPHSISATFASGAFTIIANAGAGGTITPTGAVSVTRNADQTFSIAADPCHVIADVIVDGVSKGAISTYTFSNVKTAHTISAAFSQLNYNITASAGPNGTITPNGVTSVNCGASQAYTITTGQGFNIQDVMVDGVSQGAIGTYTFNNITGPHNISATFASGAFTIIASAGTGGTITPAGAVSVTGGGNQTFSISADPCHQIADVIVDGISQGAISTYSFSNVTTAHTISATFSQLSYIITASAGANGNITPNGTAAVNCGGSQTFTISANSCYQVADVIVDGISQGAISAYTFTNVTTAHTISAAFSLLSYTITASAGPNGSISPSGPTLLNCGDKNVYIITANEGFTIQDVVVDGVSQGAIGTYTFNNITATHTISATFVSGAFTITASAGANGTITPAGAVSVAGGTSQTFNIAANSCYQIADVVVDGVSQGAIGSYTFSNVSAAHSISATFSQPSYNITAIAGANGSITPNGTAAVNCGGSQTVTISANSCYHVADVIVDGVSQGPITTYTFTNVTSTHSISATFSPLSYAITASAGANGSISPTGATFMGCGASQVYTITPNQGFNIQDVLVDGVSQGAIGTYTFNNITATHTISATFASGAFTITASAAANGTITPAGAVSVAGGASQTFNIAANSCYQIADVVVDGISRGAIATYTFNNVTATHTISATFSQLSYIITASAGANGTITPNGVTSINCGASQTFNIAANSCYQIADVIVDGVSQGATATYTFNNVTATHTISATFSQLSYNITASAGANGTITPNGATSVSCGTNRIYNITANTGFVVQAVLVDGVSQGNINTYTFNNVTSAHTISATFTAASGCVAPTLSSSISNVLCRGGSTGAINVTTSGGTAPFTYAWIGPNGFTANTKDIAGLPTGSYRITVTAAGGCTSTALYAVTQPSATLAIATTWGTIACNGGSTSVVVSAIGGTLPYTGTGTIPNQTAGTKTYTVTDANGCTVSRTITITQPASPLIITPTLGTIQCAGGTTTLTLTTAGGVGAKQYSLNGGAFQAGNIFTVDATGSPYTVAARDANQCIVTINVTVTQPAVLTATATSTAVTSGSNGTATAVPAGGTGPYTYTWNTTPVQTTAIATGLPAGNYTVTVRDFRGCTTTANTTVSSSGCNITASASAGTIACFGGTTTLTVTAGGGTGSLQYSLNGGAFQQSNTFTVNAAGSPYTVTVRDASLCTAITNSVTATQPTVLTATASSNAVTTIGGSNGTATAAPVGGTAPYTYSWNTTPVQTTITATSLPAGAYIVTITDFRGCTTTATTTVASPGCSIGASASAGTIACFGGTTTLTVTATGATAPLQYSLNGAAFQAGNTFTVNASGTAYTVIVKDANNCTASTAPVTVTQPTALAASAVAGIACNGGTTSVTVTATGGTAPYSGTGVITLQAIGPHTYTVTDTRGCTSSATITIASGAVPAKPVAVAGPVYGLCGGGSFTYTVDAVAGATGYTWALPTGFVINSGQGTNQIQVTVPASFTGTGTIGVSPTNSCGTGTQYRFSVFAVLYYPGTSIAGPSVVAPGQANVQYSLPFAAATTFNWLVPAGATITGGQGTNIVTVRFGSNGGNISVDIINACGTAPRASKPVTIALSKAAPATVNDSLKAAPADELLITKTYFSVYPNPAQRNAIAIFNSQKMGTKYEVVVSNAMGKILFTKSGTTIAGKNMLQLELGKFANGMYLVTLLTDDKHLTYKLLKQ